MGVGVLLGSGCLDVAGSKPFKAVAVYYCRPPPFITFSDSGLFITCDTAKPLLPRDKLGRSGWEASPGVEVRRGPLCSWQDFLKSRAGIRLSRQQLLLLPYDQVLTV